MSLPNLPLENKKQVPTLHWQVFSVGQVQFLPCWPWSRYFMWKAGSWTLMSSAAPQSFTSAQVNAYNKVRRGFEIHHPLTGNCICFLRDPSRRCRSSKIMMPTFTALLNAKLLKLKSREYPFEIYVFKGAVNWSLFYTVAESARFAVRGHARFALMETNIHLFQKMHVCQFILKV